MVTISVNGFVFEQSKDYRLRMVATGGSFTQQPEWYYMVHRPLEAQRGLDPNSDLFSPGYLAVDLEGGQNTRVSAVVEVGAD